MASVIRYCLVNWRGGVELSGWVLRGMLERAGFAVEKCRSNDEFVTEYACRKISEVAGE